MKNIFILGDFNFPNVDLSNYSSSSNFHSIFIECLFDCFWSQLINSPTRYARMTVQQYLIYAARFVSSDYSSYSSVTGMTRSLGWDSLEKRRYVDSVTLMYKVVHNLVLIPLPNSVQSSYSRTHANHPYKFMHIFANSNAYSILYSGTACLDCLGMLSVQNQLGVSKLS